MEGKLKGESEIGSKDENTLKVDCSPKFEGEQIAEENPKAIGIKTKNKNKRQKIVFNSKKTTQSKIKPENVVKAITALKGHIKKTTKTNETEDLFTEAEMVWIQFTFHKVLVKKDIYPKKILLKTPIISENGDVAIIMKENASEIEEKLKKSHKKYNFKVYNRSQLKTDFFTVNSKKALRDSCDILLADKNATGGLASLLGTVFIKRKKMPMRLNMTKLSFKEELDKALSSTPITLSGNLCCQVKIGNIEFLETPLAENANTVIKYVTENLPGGWSNIRNISVKTSSSISLPLFLQKPPKVEEPDLRAIKDMETTSEVVDKAIEEFKNEGENAYWN